MATFILSYDEKTSNYENSSFSKEDLLNFLTKRVKATDVQTPVGSTIIFNVVGITNMTESIFNKIKDKYKNDMKFILARIAITNEKTLIMIHE
jgi:hypothetical protein